jgi:hypothetical protein
MPVGIDFFDLNLTFQNGELFVPIAAKLYQSVGFRKTEELTHEMWGSTVTEVKYELLL